MTQPPARLPRSRTPVLKGPAALAMVAGGFALLAVMAGIAWRTTNPVWFLLFPVLLLGVLAALAVGVLWGLRHF